MLGKKIKRMCNVIQGGQCDEQSVNQQSYNISMNDLQGASAPTTKVKTNKNHIYFYDLVSAQNMMQVRMNVQALIDQLLLISGDFRGELPLSAMSINLHVCTLGGDVYHGIAMYDYLQSIKKKYKINLNIFVQGYVCSAGTMFLMAGDNRYISSNSFIMIHQLSTWFSGKYEQMKEQMALCDKLMDKVYKIYSDNSNLTVDELKQNLKKDLWMTAEQALDYGFVTQIV